MTLPNFLIVGAAKSGTTALAQLVGEHPDVFMAPVNDTCFFLFEGQPPTFGPRDEGQRRRVITDRRTYEALFDNAGDAKAVGEKSVWYLPRPDKFADIKRQLGDPRMIAILRDPAERAFSAYSHLVRDGRETEPTLSAGMAREDERRELGWEYLWQYRRLGMYASQVEALFEVFGRDRVLLLLHHDLRAEAGAVVASAYRFLGVDARFVPRLSARPNVSGRPRSKRLHSFVVNSGRLRRTLTPLLPLGLRQQIFRWNLRTIEFPAEERVALTAYYEQDVRRLAALTGLDLSRWLPDARSNKAATPSASA